MRTLIFILSAAAILFLTNCEEDPTSSNFSNGLRSIKLYNLNSNSVSKIEDVNNVVYDCVYKDSAYFAYSTFYHAIGELVARNLYSYYGGYSYFEGGPIYDLQLYPEKATIFLTASDGIYSVNEYDQLVSNLTKSLGSSFGSPVFISSTNTLTYGRTLISETNDGVIISQNLETTAIDTLLSVRRKMVIPIFITADGTHLIYTETDFNTFAVSIKSLNLFNLQDIKTLTNSIPISKLGKNRSVDDKIAFTSKGTVYVLDLNTGDILNVATSGQFADISYDGQKVVFTTGSEMYLINSDGTNQQKLISKVAENKYLFLPSFSSDDEQIVFVESDYYYGYY
jgi:dipeptidyl aminopeptidase/acylaminoacyl peptidase